MPSSVHTVLSTSKHTPVAVRRRSMTSSEGSLLESRRVTVGSDIYGF